ncbi:MAG: SRPBCC family protein [Actinomycetota bacterium]|nr:SRPBCC family protein [Actinomycetota bacterium]
MAPISESIEIDRTPDDVFAYLDEVERHGEWQEQIVAVEPQDDGPLRVGSRVKETRRVPGGDRTMTYEVTEHNPPRQSSFRVLDGPVRADGTISIEPIGDGSRSRLTITIDFTGHGLAGKVLLPVARTQARKQIPKDQARMKELLESHD